MKHLKNFIIFLLANLLIIPQQSLIQSREYKLPPLIEEALAELENTIQSRTAVHSEDCLIDINKDIKNPQPLFISPGSSKFYNPDKFGRVHIKSGDQIELYCSKGFKGSAFQSQKKIIPICAGGGNLYNFNKKTYNFEQFICKGDNLYEIRRAKTKCYNNSTIIEVGFVIETRFLRLYEVCHDERIESTLYVHHYLNPSSGNPQINVTRPTFKQDKFYKRHDINKLYTLNVQKKTIGQILNSNIEKYFDEKHYIYLARGHLSAKADHIYGSQQLSTFYFFNAAPQWQRFNSGSWQNIENTVRNYATKKQIYLECYTGTWGVSTLPDRNGKPKPLFLYFDNQKRGMIPVPMLYYRVVIEPATKRGVVFLGVNNPYLTLEEIQRDYIICQDISEQISWIKLKKNDMFQGYAYACEVNEFAQVVGHLPHKLNVQGILK